MKIEKFVELLKSDFYTGVPDSLLKPLSSYLMNTYGLNPKHHLIAANEGNAVGIAAGYYLATRKIPVVYMQNSGEGNAINPIASLLNDKIYGIPMIFVVGWRGEPGTKDEPQHIYQGEVTIKLLEDMNIRSFIVSKETTEEMLINYLCEVSSLLENGKQVAFVVKKDSFEYINTVKYKNDNSISREDAIRHIISISIDDPVISTTGKASRELFEARKENEHKYDFLTVGSMGHSSSIALGVAINQPKKKIWCIDGDGALIMHMGSLATIGSVKPNNFIHVILNNNAHESVGGMPTVADKVNLCEIAKACGYENAISVNTIEDLNKELIKAKKMQMLSFIEIKCSISSREDLGRPTTSTKDNKNNFIDFLTKE